MQENSPTGPIRSRLDGRLPYRSDPRTWKNSWLNSIGKSATSDRLSKTFSPPLHRYWRASGNRLLSPPCDPSAGFFRPCYYPLNGGISAHLGSADGAAREHNRSRFKSQG